jgi:hypothetical protein
MPDNPYPGDDATLAYRLCAQVLSATKREDEEKEERRKTSRRAMIENQKRRKANAEAEEGIEASPGQAGE